MPFRIPQPITKPPPTPKPKPTQPQLPSPPHYTLTPTHPCLATLAARLAYTSEPRFLPNGELTRPDPMPGYIPVQHDDRLPQHPRPASISSWHSGRRAEKRREAKPTSTCASTTTEGRVEKKKGREEARVGTTALRHMELAMRPKSASAQGQMRHEGWHVCEHTAAAAAGMDGSNGNTTVPPRESGRGGGEGKRYVRCTCCGREYQAKSPAELKPNTKPSICRDCGRRMNVEHGESEEMKL